VKNNKIKNVSYGEHQHYRLSLRTRVGNIIPQRLLGGRIRGFESEVLTQLLIISLNHLLIVFF